MMYKYMKKSRRMIIMGGNVPATTN